MYCVGGASALELYRASGRLLPDLLERPRTSKLDGCSAPPPVMLADDMRRLGVSGRPYCLVFGDSGRAGSRPDVRRCVLDGRLPRNSFIRVNEDALVASPELMFAMLAALPEVDEIDLALIGYELCGLYVLDPHEEGSSWDGLITNRTTMTSTTKIGRMLEGLAGRHGVKKARAALELVNDTSNSPMETVLAALLGFPRRLGGLGLGPIVLNRRIATSVGDRWVDVYFPDHEVGLEYKGRQAHSIEKVGRDDRRQNKLTGAGVTILNVWYEDLANPHLFAELVDDVVKALGVRLRIRSAGFARRQELLRMRLMPAIERYGSLVF